MKGIIAEVENKRAVFLSDSGEFYTIDNKNYEIGETVEYLPNTYYRSIYSIIACFIIMLFCGFGGYKVYNDPTTYVSIDINPSIQLNINRFNRVIETIPINEDAQTLVKTINVDNKLIREAVDKIIDASENMGYLDEDNNHIEIGIFSEKRSVIEEIESSMSKYTLSEFDVNVEKADKKDVTLSSELGISIGRAKAIREYTKIYGGNAENNAEELSDLSLGEVKKSIKKDKESITPNSQNSNNNSKTNSSAQAKSSISEPTNNQSENDGPSDNKNTNAPVKQKTNGKDVKDSNNNKKPNAILNKKDNKNK